MSSAAGPSTSPPPATQPGGVVVQPADLVAALPAPLLRLLILFAGPTSALRAALEILAWKPERRLESYLVLLGWWATCLGFSYAFALLLPPLVFAPLIPLGRLRLGKSTTPPLHPSPNSPATSETLLLSVSDMYRIHALLPPNPIPPLSAVYARFRQLGARRLIRGLLVLWGVWVALGHALGTRVLLGLVGSVLILAPSPLLSHTVHLLAKSLAVRRAVALTFLFIFGSPPGADYKASSPLGWLRAKWAASRTPSLTLAFTTETDANGNDDDDDDFVADGSPIYFKFEVFENQRWWMGLDWTSALLPQERPSWCDSHLLPVSPPGSFALPPPSSIDLPAPTKSEPRAQVRRTATWRWIDDDWAVVRKGGDAAAAPAAPAPVVPAIPEDEAKSPTTSSRPSSGLFSTSPDDSRTPSAAESAFAKGLGRLKSVSGLPPGSPSASPTKTTDIRRLRAGSEAASEASVADTADGTGAGAIPETNEVTDADGWVYGDNKWENMGPRGGLGKFTRRRRWQRRAVCTETVTRIPELAPARRHTDPLPAPDTNISPPGSGAATPVGRGPSLKSAPAPAPVAPVTADASAELADGASSGASSALSRDDALRQRLKKAMGNVGA
ncbi:Peroxisomal membrane protein PEX30 [Vanrija pseudolonga]|uniref:Peroxisomal membrane protein PEX30 n=1 Tax=Vanrija pseudolonga TaxID=143232 RepID=A0AAF1BM68_9TREE|nr:Peroxisomal membrane protein PEX30 [Vanrija pseudolonga]